MADTKNINHDRLFKNLLTVFIKEFLYYFYRDIYNQITFSRGIVAVTNDTDNPYLCMFKTTPRYVDRAFLVYDKKGNQMILHFECQSYNQAIFNKRVRNYNYSLQPLYEDAEIHSFAICFKDYTAKNLDNTYESKKRKGLVHNPFKYNKINLKNENWRDPKFESHPMVCALAPLMKKRRGQKNIDLAYEILSCLKNSYHQISEKQLIVILDFVDEYLELDSAELKTLMDRFNKTKDEKGIEFMEKTLNILDGFGQTRKLREVVVKVASAKFYKEENKIPEDIIVLIRNIEDTDVLQNVLTEIAVVENGNVDAFVSTIKKIV